MDILLDHFFCDLSPLQKKKVRFSEIVNCVLIPCCRELFVIKEELWWTSNECDSFYYSSVREIKNFIKKALKTCQNLQFQKDDKQFLKKKINQNALYKWQILSTILVKKPLF